MSMNNTQSYNFLAPYSLLGCVAKLQSFEEDQVHFSTDNFTESNRTIVEVWMIDAGVYQFEMKRISPNFRWFPLVAMQGTLTEQNSNQTQVSYTLNHYWKETAIAWTFIAIAISIFTVFQSEVAVSCLPILIIFGVLPVLYKKWFNTSFIQRQLRYVLSTD